MYIYIHTQCSGQAAAFTFRGGRRPNFLSFLLKKSIRLLIPLVVAYAVFVVPTTFVGQVCMYMWREGIHINNVVPTTFVERVCMYM